MKFVLITLLLVLTFGAADAAEIFHFTDRNGTINFVDDYGKVPRHIRRQRAFGHRAMAVQQEQATRIIVRDNQVFVPVILEHGGSRKEVLFLLDTGASQTALLAPAAARLGFEEYAGAKASWEVVGGGTVSGRRQKIGVMKVGPHQLHDFEIGVVDHKGKPPDFDGLLGMDFLGRVTYRIDIPASTIYWRH